MKCRLDREPGLPLAEWDDQLVYDSDVVAIGRFRARPDEPHFRFSGLPGAHLFVFPHHEVWIEHEDRAPFVADRSCITFYNPAQLYRRRAISEQGDRGDWFALAPEILREIVARHDRDAADVEERLFPFPEGPVDDASFFFERSLLANLSHQDPLLVEEGSILIAQRVIALAYSRGSSSSRQTCQGEVDARHRDAVEATRDVLARRFRESLSLAEIAREVGCSVFHLSRIFRRHTGLTVHRYRTLLRQRQALQEILDAGSSPVDLSRLALDLGYSSHSHFGQEFRRVFGVPPSRAGLLPPTRLLERLD